MTDLLKDLLTTSLLFFERYLFFFLSCVYIPDLLQRLLSALVDLEMTTQITKSEHLVPIRTRDPVFAQYDTCFSKKLVCLFEIKYRKTTLDNQTAAGDSPNLDVATLASLNLDDEWSSVPYFHGTTHCECCKKRVHNSKNRSIAVDKWCTSESCPTKGIITHGFLQAKSPGGHFFSPNATRAIKFAQRHIPEQQFLPIFVCMARKVQTAPGQFDLCWVDGDQDIIPRFLAIVQRNQSS
ncbi:hypothetical protein BGZ68_001113 [Mortierella alpina]|nr:hypothetical protein BGZ68_001113 [Mortierella alpina]